MGVSDFGGASLWFCHWLEFPYEEDIKSSISTTLLSRLSLPLTESDTPPLTLHHRLLPLGRVLLPRAQPQVLTPIPKNSPRSSLLQTSEGISPGLGGCLPAPDRSSPWGNSLTIFHVPSTDFCYRLQGPQPMTPRFPSWVHHHGQEARQGGRGALLTRTLGADEPPGFLTNQHTIAHGCLRQD